MSPKTAWLIAPELRAAQPANRGEDGTFLEGHPSRPRACAFTFDGSAATVGLAVVHSAEGRAEANPLRGSTLNIRITERTSCDQR